MDLMVNDFTFKAVKEQMVVLFDSYAKRTFIHVDDAAACYLFGLENFDKLKNEVYNAGADHLNYSKMDVAQAIKKFVDFEIIDPGIKDKDLRHFIISFEKLNTKGFVPQKTIEQGIQEMLRIFKFYEYFTHYKQI
jgi:nucleoside-diphosphate-sugar epimerase